jgi:uncharacterized membrane protein YtjA (UPF0391 family)
VVFRMFGAALVFLIIAIVAALFGFGVVSDDAPLVTKMIAGFFLLLAGAAFWWARLARAPQSA